MPRCHLSQKFLHVLVQQPPSNLIHYMDYDIPGFLLEYRPKGTGTWYFRYRDTKGAIRFQRIGSLREVSVQDARAKAHEIDKLVQEGGDPKTELNGSTTRIFFKQFAVDYYLPHAKMKKRSWAVDERILRQHILPIFENYRLKNVRRLNVMCWQSALRKQLLAPSTCNRILSLLRYMFACAIQWGLLPAGKNPCDGVTPYEDNGARERYLKADEARRLILALDALPNRQSAMALKLLLFTGARKSEILGSRWENIDISQRRLTVPLSKSGKTRYIPLSDEAIAIIESLPHCPDSPWLFAHPETGKPLRSLFYTWNCVRTQLGLTDVRIHDLRHSFASFLINSGCSLYSVQKILGHGDPRVTMRYAHLADDALISAAGMVGKYVFESH